MNNEELALAYENVITDAEAAAYRPPPAGEWGAELILAHLIANDGLLVAALREVLAGHSPTYDNAPAVDVDALSRIVAGAGRVDALIDQLRATSSRVVELASKIDDGHAATMIPTRIVDGGTVQVDQPLPLAAILRAQTTLHLPSHRAQLASLAIAG
jgi:hypothetical protein